MNGHTRPRSRWFIAASLSAVALCAALGFVIFDGSEPAAADHGSTGLQGIDVSAAQGSVDWNAVRAAGVQFAYLANTRGTSQKDPAFNTNYPAAYRAGVIRGAVHVAVPSLSGGAAQADYFASNGGAWSADNRTLPGALVLEPNPYGGGYCYGLTTAAMRTWISNFHARYHSRTTRDVVIHTTPSWWNTCTGSWTGMASKSPLWVAHWDVHAPRLPAGWSSTTWTFWQWTNCREVAGIADCAGGDRFNGTRDRLVALANNTP
ncbi:MAG: GH25 family lysozyme [Micromonosporaceae bacterium]